MTSCGAVDSKKDTNNLIISKPFEYTKAQQIQAAEELEILDRHYKCKGCSILQSMMIRYKRLRDKNRIARGEKLP